MLCWSHTSSARRAYRIDRIGDVGALEHAFSPPGELDPVAVLEEHLAVGWEYDVEVVVDAPFAKAARCLPRALGKLTPIDDEHCRLVGSTSNPAWYAEQLTATPASFLVAGGPELAEAVRRLGRRLLAAGGADEGPTVPGT